MDSVLFVLGAGASVDFGYPTNNELREIILTDNDLHQFLLRSNLSQFDLDVFLKTFKDSGLSIDAFLQSSETFENQFVKFMDIGKIAIAYTILKKEKESNITTKNNNWCTYLYSSYLSRNTHPLFNGKVSFITFNYDLSLENFFFNAIKSSFYGHSMTQQQRNNLISNAKSIEIHHVYGSAGFLNWQDVNGREYGQWSDGEVFRIVNNISLMRKIKTEMDKVKELLMTASHICFLGFGFDDINIQRLSMGVLEHNSNLKSLRCTGYGLEGLKKQHFYNSLPVSKRGIFENSGSWGLQKESIQQFLGDRCDFLLDFFK